jgi:hypothetical protein
MSAGVNNDMRLSQTIRTEDATAETFLYSQCWRRRSRSPPPTIADAREPPGHPPGGFPRRTVGACHAHLTFNTPRKDSGVNVGPPSQFLNSAHHRMQQKCD